MGDSGGRLLVVNDPFIEDTGSSSSEEDEINHRAVHHLVLAEGFLGERTVLRDYEQQLRELLNSIAKSPLAKEQIGIVFALPCKGAAVERSRQDFNQEYQQYFKWLISIPQRDDLVSDQKKRDD